MNINISNCQVYYISFDPNIETENRLKRFFKHIKHVPAVDARSWNDAQARTMVVNHELSPAAYTSLHDSFQRMTRSLPRIGAIGCSLSHRNCWSYCKPDNFIAIAEEDVAFHSGASLSTISDFFTNNNGKNGRIFMCTIPFLHADFGTHFYILDYAACQTLIALFLPIEIQVDAYIQLLGKHNFLTLKNDSKIAYQKPHNSSIQAIDIRTYIYRRPIQIIMAMMFVLIAVNIVIIILLKITRKKHMLCKAQLDNNGSNNG